MRTASLAKSTSTTYFQSYQRTPSTPRRARLSSVALTSGKVVIGCVLVDVIVVHLETAADFHLELAVAAREFRCALPFDLQVEIAACGTFGSRSGRRGLCLGVLHLLLQGLDGGLHLIDLRLNLLQILRFGFWSPNGQKSDNTRPSEQIAVHFS